MLEKDLESVRGIWTMMDEKNGCVGEYEMEIGRVCGRVGTVEREERVGFVAITPTIKLFSSGSGELFFTGIGQDEEWRVWNG